MGFSAASAAPRAFDLTWSQSLGAMSASPAGPPSGPASTTPNGGAPAPARRRRPPGNPFIQKKPARKPPGQGPFAAPRANGTPHGRPSTVNPQQSNGQPLATKAAPDPDDDPSLYSEYPLVATKKAILDGLRFHAMRLMTTGEANPYDPEQFTPPLRLHRRFPRDKMMDPEAAGLAVDSKDREKEEIRKAERQAEKEANQAQIAPTEKAAAAKKRPQFKKKIEDVFYPQDTPEAQKRSKLRYEEGRPWHLEDFDGKNSWVGTYEEPLSESHAMLVLDKNGNFRMVPLEKWYRFVPTGRYKTMDLDEAEKHMDKKVKASRWFLDNAQGVDQKRRADHERQQHQQRGRVGMRGEDRPAKTEDDDGERMDMANDIDEIDFEHDDEFQDDDEGKLIGGDEEEDVKDSERRIRQEMLGANIFAGTGVKEEKDWDEEEEREKKEAQEERKKAKRLRKNLIKREKKYEYESESDHPYSEEVRSLLGKCHCNCLTYVHRATRKTLRRSANVKKKRRRKRKKKRMPKSPTGTSSSPVQHRVARVRRQVGQRSVLSL